MNRSEIISGMVDVAGDVSEPVSAPVKPSARAAVVEALSPSDECNIEVEFVDTNQILVDSIYDSHGRMSDAIDAVSRITGYNAISLNATDLPREVEYLQRHLLYPVGGDVYAMSNEVRQEKIDEYCKKIKEFIAQGVVFSEKLNRTFNYAGGVYSALDLTKFEWTTILSKFKGYRSRLYLRGGTDLILEVYPERV